MKALLSPTIDELLEAQVDIAKPNVVDVKFSEDRATLWVNVDGVCVLRICQIAEGRIDFGTPPDGGADELPIDSAINDTGLTVGQVAEKFVTEEMGKDISTIKEVATNDPERPTALKISFNDGTDEVIVQLIHPDHQPAGGQSDR